MGFLHLYTHASRISEPPVRTPPGTDKWNEARRLLKLICDRINEEAVPRSGYLAYPPHNACDASQHLAHCGQSRKGTLR